MEFEHQSGQVSERLNPNPLSVAALASVFHTSDIDMACSIFTSADTS